MPGTACRTKALGGFPPLNVLQVSTSLVSSPWTSSFRNLTPLAQAGQAGGVSMDLEDELKALNVEADGVVEAGQMLTGQQQQELVAAQGELAAAAAVFPQQQGNFDAAANAVQQLQQMAERLALEGVSSPMLLQDKGDLLAAKEVLLREALKAQREMLGARHPDTLKSICKLSKLLQDKGDLRRREICRLATSEHARHHEQLRRLKGDLDAAEPLLREVLEAQREMLGARHPDTLASINSLGMLLQDKGDLLAAMELLLREVLEEQREMLGPRHPDTLASINSLGMLLYDKGELAAAEPLLLEAKRWWSL